MNMCLDTIGESQQVEGSYF